jgi:hypothetical protein
MAVGVAAMLKNSESMLVDRKRDGNIGKLRWKMTVCGKMVMPKTASFGPFSANRMRQARLPSFVLQLCDTNLISRKHTSSDTTLVDKSDGRLRRYCSVLCTAFGITPPAIGNFATDHPLCGCSTRKARIFSHLLENQAYTPACSIQYSE